MNIKKFAAVAVAALISAAAWAQKDIKQLEADLNSDDIHTADAARMAIEKYPDAEIAENILLKALPLQQNQVLQEGIIYSLGAIGGEKSLEEIERIAAQNSPLQKIAILSIGNFKSRKAQNMLREIAKQRGDYAHVADIALVVAGAVKEKDGLSYIPKSAETFAAYEENRQVEILSTLPVSDRAKKFLTELDSDSPRIKTALCFALAKQNGGDAVSRIFDISDSLDKELVQMALIMCAGKDADAEIIKRINQNSPAAITAAGERGLLEAEAPLLKLAKSENAELSKAAFASLQNIATEKTAALFLKEISAGDESNLAQKVNVCIKAIKRLDDDKLDAQKNSIAELSKNAPPKARAAFEKISDSLTL